MPQKKIYQKIPPARSTEEMLKHLSSAAGIKETKAGFTKVLERDGLAHLICVEKPKGKKA